MGIVLRMFYAQPAMAGILFTVRRMIIFDGCLVLMGNCAYLLALGAKANIAGYNHGCLFSRGNGGIVPLLARDRAGNAIASAKYSEMSSRHSQRLSFIIILLKVN